MAGILTKDMALAVTPKSGTKMPLSNLMEVPEIGNNAPEKIDITVLSDGVKKSMAGLKDSSQDLAFKFLYEEKQFTDLDAIKETAEWELTIPQSEIKATFSGTPSVKLGASAPNGALTYTLNVSVESEIVFAKPNA